MSDVVKGSRFIDVNAFESYRDKLETAKYSKPNTYTTYMPAKGKHYQVYEYTKTAPKGLEGIISRIGALIEIIFNYTTFKKDSFYKEILQTKFQGKTHIVSIHVELVANLNPPKRQVPSTPVAPSLPTPPTLSSPPVAPSLPKPPAPPVEPSLPKPPSSFDPLSGIAQPEGPKLNHLTKDRPKKPRKVAANVE